MTLVYAQWGYPDFFGDVLEIAIERSRSDKLVIISDNEVGNRGQSWINIRSLLNGRYRAGEFLEWMLKNTPSNSNYAYCLARWMVLAEWLKTRYEDVDWPLCVADWDMVIFEPIGIGLKPGSMLARTLSPTKDFAMWPMFHREACPIWTVAEGLLNRFRMKDPSLLRSHDMAEWSIAIDRNQWSCDNLYAPSLGGVFDHNIHDPRGIFECEDDGYKKIGWEGGIPYFTIKGSDERVMANTIHCWGKYKSMTGELLKKARVTA